MSLPEKIAALLPTKISSYSALSTLLLAAAPIPLRGLLAEWGLSVKMALISAVAITGIILLVGTLVCLVSVVIHCHKQAEKIKSLEQELKNERLVNMAEKLRAIQDQPLVNPLR